MPEEDTSSQHTEPPDGPDAEVSLEIVESEEEIERRLAELDRDELAQAGKIACFIAQPLPPSLNQLGGSMSAHGAVGCTAPVALGIRVCIQQAGVARTCSPPAPAYKWVFGATNSGWANRPGCTSGLLYSTKVSVEARANNVSQKSKESIDKRLC